jgi:hypothetical protein
MWKSSVLRPKGVELARTEAFNGMTVFARASVFAFLSLGAPPARIGWLANLLPFGAVGTALLAEAAAVWRALLRELLHTMPLALDTWTAIGLLAVPPIAAPECMASALLRRARPSGARPASAD